MISKGVIQYEVTSISLLTPVLVSAWATKPVWYWREAVKLSIGCCPEPTVNEKVLSPEESIEWGAKLGNRTDESERAMLTGDLPHIKIPYQFDDKNTFPAFKPLEFVNWLHRSKLSHPPELFDAVRNYHARELRESDREPGYMFRKKLQAWEVRFGNLTLDGVKDLLGMTYIQLLLQHGDQHLDVFELDGLAGYHTSTPNQDDDSDDNVSESSEQYSNNLSEYAEAPDAVLDDQARRQYREELDRLKANLEIAEETGDSAAQAAIRQEMEFYARELNRATGLAGRSRQLNASSEKYRKRIRKAISDALDNIRLLETRQGHQDSPIAAHLSKCIKKGVTCYYDNTLNNPPIEWYF